MHKDQIIKLAVEAVMEYNEKQRQKNIKSRHDIRLRNTRLLLKNYNLLKAHCNKSVFKLSQTVEEETAAIDILDALNQCTGDVYIESIKNSVVRTQIIISHIDTMLKMYKIFCDESDKEEDRRRYRMLRSVYFEKQKIDAICEQENVDRRTYFRDTNDACEKLSALIFGFDGLSDMSQ